MRQESVRVCLGIGMPKITQVKLGKANSESWIYRDLEGVSETKNTILAVQWIL
jgi:hypothetical protein